MLRRAKMAFWRSRAFMVLSTYGCFTANSPRAMLVDEANRVAYTGSVLYQHCVLCASPIHRFRVPAASRCPGSVGTTVVMLDTSNQALERTATRCAFTFSDD